MASKVKTGLAVACEHIVMGVGNKPTFIGCFTGDIILDSFPASFWIAFYVEIINWAQFPERFHLQLRVGDEVVATIELMTGGFSASEPAIVSLPSGIVSVQGPITIKLEVADSRFAGAELISRNVVLNPEILDGGSS